MKIKAYTSYNERNKIHHYCEFEVIDELPPIGDVDDYIYSRGYKSTVERINEVMLDAEQGNDKVYSYNYYEIVKKVEIYSSDDEIEVEYQNEYVAIEKEFEEEVFEEEEI